MSKHKNHKEKGRARRRILIAVLVICLFVIGFIGGSFFYVFGGLTTTKLDQDNTSLGISQEAEQVGNSKVTNIALFGVDTRGTDDKGRSDATMILSINEGSGEISMISLLRDSKVSVDGHGQTKLNHAYAYGGAPLAVKTINQNFKMNIKDYVTVNFHQLADIVDAVNGVTMSLTPQEVEQANLNMGSDFPSDTPIIGSGELELNGDQAVAFARIRSIDSDNARADRQQQVLKAIFAKIQSMPKTDYPSFIRHFLEVTETSLGYADLLGLSPIMLAGNLSIEQYMVPDQHEAPWGGTDTDGVWYWKYDLNAAADRIHSIIYE